MKKILSYNKYNFLKEHNLIKEDYGSEFNQYQFGTAPGGLGPGYGFAVDDQISIYSHADSPYVDPYYKTPYMVNNLMHVMKSIYKQGVGYGATKFDHFIEDVEEYTEFKILRIVQNNNLTLDVYVAFTFYEEEFFGAYKKFNWIQKPELLSDLFTDSRYTYIDFDYRLKLSNYLYKILIKWFTPKKGEYSTLKDIPVRDEMGNTQNIPENKIIQVVSSSNDKDGNSYIIIKYKDTKYTINKNNYFFFNYWTETIE